MAPKWVAAAGSLRFNTKRSLRSKTQKMTVHEPQPSQVCFCPRGCLPHLGGEGEDNCFFFCQSNCLCCCWAVLLILWFIFLFTYFPNISGSVSTYQVPTVGQAFGYRQGLQEELDPIPAFRGHDLVGRGHGAEESAAHDSYCDRSQCPEFK